LLDYDFKLDKKLWIGLFPIFGNQESDLFKVLWEGTYCYLPPFRGNKIKISIAKINLINHVLRER